MLLKVISGLFLASLTLIMCQVSSNAVEMGRYGTREDPFAAQMEDRIPRLLKMHKIPGAGIAVIRHGEIAWIRAFDNADARKTKKVSLNTVYRVESLSKPVTAWGVMKLAEDGYIELDRPVSQYLRTWNFPESAFDAEKITVRQLLSHSSGLGLGTIGDEYDPKGTIPGLLEHLNIEAVPVSSPGRSFLYSNPGYQVLELLIEELSGQNFSDFMKKEVLDPLKMETASFEWSEEYHHLLPDGHDTRGRMVPPYIYPGKASGGLFAGIEDMARFAIAGMTGIYFPDQGILRQQSVQEMYQPVVKANGLYGLVSDGYGLGFFSETLKTGETAVFQGGQGHGWMSHMHLIPEAGEGIVILTNSQRSWPFFAEILSNWSRWTGYSKPGMTILLIANRVLWGLTLILCVLVIIRVIRFARGLISGKRICNPFSISQRSSRLVKAFVGATIIAGTAYIFSLDYFFIFSVFPAASGWFILVFTMLAATLAAESLFPLREENIQQNHH